jgi:hypothetical protein
VEELQSMITKLIVSQEDLIVSQEEQKSILFSLVQQKKLEDFNFSRVSNQCVSRAISALNVEIGGHLHLPELLPYMPLSSDVRAYPWGATEGETSVSGNLLKLLTTWVTFGAVPNILNRFFDVQSLSAHNSMEIIVDSVGTFRGMPDAIASRSTVCDFHEIGSISSSTLVSVDWKTPSAFANASKVNPIGHIQAIAFENLSQRSIPVFFTDMSSGFKCWIVVESKLYYLHKEDGQSLTLTEGIALMRYFLVRSEVNGSKARIVNGSLSHYVASNSGFLNSYPPSSVGHIGDVERGEGKDPNSNGGSRLNNSSGSSKTRRRGDGGYIHSAFSKLQSPDGSVSDCDDDDISPETIRKFAIALASGGGMRFEDEGGN